MEDQEKGVAKWNMVLDGAMSLPGIKVDRTSFLTSTFKPYCNNETLLGIVNNCPALYVNPDQIDKIAKSVISSQTLKVTSISAVAGIPGGFAMIGTIPADIAQYYYHTLVVAQKLAYLYGYPSLTDDNGNLSEDARIQLTIFIGIMSSVSAANEALHAVTRTIAEQIVKKLPRKALTKTIWYPIIKRIAAWLGINVTKASFARGAAKVIPLIGAVMSGGLTYATFKPSANRLRKKLKEEMPYIVNAYK